MCTLIVCWRHWQEPWLLVAANRDEKLERPATPPECWLDRKPGLLAPRDLQAGGSWWGVNAAGVFAALTNRFGTTPPQTNRKSRGLLLVETLEHWTAAKAAQFVFQQEPSSINRFHLFIADRKEAYLLVYDGLKITCRRLGPGIHVITERSLGAADNRREKFLRKEARLWQRPPRIETLRRLLSHHEEDALDGTCVHLPSYGYGTRSSSIIRLGKRPRLLHAEGPPCQQPYRDLSPLLKSVLGQVAVKPAGELAK